MYTECRPNVLSEKFKFFILLSCFLFLISNEALLLDSLDIDGNQKLG